MAFKQRAKAGPKEVRSLRALFRPSERKAPDLLDYQRHEMIDGRPLRPGEKERLLSLLQGESDLQWDQEQNEARCAAAYACVKLGIKEALPIIQKMIADPIESPHVLFAFEFAVACFRIMEEHDIYPERGRELMSLLEMRDSEDLGERRFAQLVLEKADIKYGTFTSW